MKLRRLAVGAALISLLVLAVLHVAGSLDDVHAWFSRYFQPEVWAAIAAWVTAGIAVVAGIYAKGQLDQARIARKSQEEQSRNALSQQSKLFRDQIRNVNLSWPHRDGLIWPHRGLGS